MDAESGAAQAADLLKRAENTRSLSEKTALLQEVVDTCGNADAPALRAAAGRARLLLAYMERNETARQRLFQDIVDDYRNDDNPALASVVLDAAYGVLGFMHDKEKQLALCDDMLARYAGVGGRAESRRNHFVMHRRMLVKNSPEDSAAIDRELARHLADPAVFSVNDVNHLLHDRYDQHDPATCETVRQWCRREAETAASPGIAAGLLGLAAGRAPKADKPAAYREIIRRHTDSDDAAAVCEAAEAALYLAREGDDAGAMVPVLDALLRDKKAALYPGLEADLLMARADLAPDAEEKEKLYGQIIQLREDTRSPDIAKRLYLHQLHDIRNRALHRAALLAGSPDVYFRFLDSLDERPLLDGGPHHNHLVACEYAGLGKETPNPNWRMALYDAALARFLPQCGDENIAGVVKGILRQKADATRDPDAARDLYRQALAMAEGMSDPFLPPTGSIHGLVRLAATNKEKIALYDRLIALCRDHAQWADKVDRYRLERAVFLPPAEREAVFTGVLDAHRDTGDLDDIGRLVATLRARLEREARGKSGPADAVPDRDGVFPYEARARAVRGRIAALRDAAFTPEALDDITKRSDSAFSVITAAYRLAKQCVDPGNRRAVVRLLEEYYGCETDQGALVCMEQMRRDEAQ